MIIILSGPLGVGKTLTAESVAEHMRVPLYMLSAGDLTSKPDEIVNKLSNVLEMATKWNAILLLDEADVVLEQRSSHENKLVSIFLRILEYYEGILFLTTNRVNDIDAAFQSRIHMSMRYDELNHAARKSVWRNFLGAVNNAAGGGEDALTDEELEKLAEQRMNGREIKNMLKTAQLLTRRTGEGLAMRHVESVLAIEQRKVGVEAVVEKLERSTLGRQKLTNGV